MKSALLFKPGSIGDCLMGKYFLEQVRAAHPAVRCTVAVPTRAGMVRDLYAAYPWIEVTDTTSLRLPRRDLVVTPYTGGVFPLRTKLFARLLAKKLIGFTDRSPLTGFIYDRVLPIASRERAPRLLECDVLAAAGVPVVAERPSFKYVPQPQLLPKLGLTPGGYAVVHLFSGSDARGLSPQKRKDLVETLASGLGVSLVVTGSPKETETLGPLPHGVQAAHTTLQELAHLLDHSAAVVSLDTGAGHLAAHLRKPLVVLSSCLGTQWWGKDMYGEGIPAKLFNRADCCQGGHKHEPYPPCLNEIASAGIVEAVKGILAK